MAAPSLTTILFLRKEMSGPMRKRLILLEYLKGILQLAETETPDTIIIGTSYFIHEKTAQKIGLQTIKTDQLQKLILLFNYFNVMACLYLANKKWVRPKLKNIRTYRAPIQAILSQKAYIQRLIVRLEESS